MGDYGFPAPVGRTTWPIALKKDTVAPKYYSCRIIVCVLGQYPAQNKMGSLYTFRRHGYSPGNQTLSGLTPIRVGPSSVIIRRSWGRVRKCRDGRDIIQGHIRHVSDAQGRHPDASTAPTWLRLLACRRLRYVTGRPSGSVDTTRMDLLECGIFLSI